MSCVVAPTRAASPVTFTCSFYIADGEAQVHGRVLSDHQRDAGADALGEAVLYRADVVLSNGKRRKLIAAAAVGLGRTHQASPPICGAHRCPGNDGARLIGYAARQTGRDLRPPGNRQQTRPQQDTNRCISAK